MKRLLSAVAALILLSSLSSVAFAKKTGIEVVDEETGEYIDYDQGEYGVLYDRDGNKLADIQDTDSDSNFVPIDSSSSAESASSGGMTVTSTDGIPVEQNSDGSMTVESGQVFVEEPENTGGQHLSPEEWAARWAKYSAANGMTTGTVYMDPMGNVHPATILEVGLGRSLIRYEEKEELVPTSSLKWDTEAPDDQVLAVVTPAKQSYITLRAKKSQKSFVMGHCDKCKVLLVIGTGKTWTMVDDQGVRGYVLTSGLTFYDNAPKNYAAGIVTIKGKTPSGNTVHPRTSNTNNARQMQEYPVGTPITVFSQDEKWSEIDIGGWHCYMLSKFVTLQEPLIVAEANTETEAKEPPI